MTAGEIPSGPYAAILADPPWAFRTYSGKHATPHRCAEDHYRTMDLPAISRLPVADCAAKNAALFLWVVDSHIDAGIELMAHWGFRFKTKAFTWLKLGKTGKPIMSLGYWSRKQTEICLLGTRGKPRRLSAGVGELIVAPRREHSRKPDEQYAKIEALVAGPYLELFARHRRPGWDAWGDQLEARR